MSFDATWIWILCFLQWQQALSSNQSVIEESRLTTTELITTNGYPAEIHSVTTSDGYILEIHRIPHGRNSSGNSRKPAVFLQHGMLATSADWVLLGPGNSLGYLLADAGYDVFLGNSRGNRYSKKHVSLSTRSSKFWDFSWHELGVLDLPAEIDYILNLTSQKQIYYVGMSMGTTVFFVLAAEKPEYNDKIRFMVAEAPIAFFNNSNGPIANSKLLKHGLRMLRALGMEEVFPANSLFKSIGENICTNRIGSVICGLNIFFQMGFDPKQLNETFLPLIYAHYPAGGSLKTMRHYSQIIDSGNFQKWDYGSKMNMVKYKQTTPPEYNLSAITVPVALLYGENDVYANPKDVSQLKRALPNCVEVYQVPWKTFGHFGFIFATDVRTLVNDKVIKLIKTY